jgi:crotonobetainyl-CoA:carnitine CoA-transferase CaiB-like acyl-CoA transferase
LQLEKSQRLAHGCARHTEILDHIRRGIRSVRLNLKKPEGREVFNKLVKSVDVVVEGFRPGVAKRLNMDYETLSKIKEDIICVSLSGFGQDGAYSGVVGHDLNYQSMAGIPHLTGKRDGPPHIPGNAIADDAGGISAALSITIALLHKERTGEGQYLDFAMVDTLLNMMLLNLSDSVRSNDFPKRGETMLTERWALYHIYECKDGKFLSVGAIEPWFWANLCKLIGCEQFIENMQPEDYDEANAQIETVQAIFMTRDRDDWIDMLTHEDTCVTPVLGLDEVMANEHHRTRGSIISGEDVGEGATDQVGMLFKMSKTPGRIRFMAPDTGENTSEILQELGYPEADIAELTETISTL